MMKAAGVPTAVAGALEMEVSDASAAAQFPPTHGTGAVAAEASGPPTTIDPDDSEIRERKRQIMELWRAGWKRCDAAQKLALSESTVKRYSKELGIDWRIPRAKR
jgi:DNA-binding NarL/FixJ family response regulator